MRVYFTIENVFKLPFLVSFYSSDKQIKGRGIMKKRKKENDIGRKFRKKRWDGDKK